jgi:hypothetical protein
MKEFVGRVDIKKSELIYSKKSFFDFAGRLKSLYEAKRMFPG